MSRLRSEIRYQYRERSGGGEVLIQSDSPEAREAVHQFLAFQRSDHHAPGHMPGHNHPAQP